MTKPEHKKTFARRINANNPSCEFGLEDALREPCHYGDLRRLNRDICEETVPEETMGAPQTVERVSQTTTYAVSVNGKEYNVIEIFDTCTGFVQVDILYADDARVFSPEEISHVMACMNGYWNREL